MGTNINRGINKAMGAATKIRPGHIQKQAQDMRRKGTGADKYIDTHRQKTHARKKQKKEQQP